MYCTKGHLWLLEVKLIIFLLTLVQPSGTRWISANTGHLLKMCAWNSPRQQRKTASARSDLDKACHPCRNNKTQRVWFIKYPNSFWDNILIMVQLKWLDLKGGPLNCPSDVSAEAHTNNCHMLLQLIAVVSTHCNPGPLVFKLHSVSPAYYTERPSALSNSSGT